MPSEGSNLDGVFETAHIVQRHISIKPNPERAQKNEAILKMSF